MSHFSLNKSSGNGSFTLKVKPSGINEGKDPIQEYLKITMNEVTKSIPLTHKSGEVSHTYTFSANPSSIPIDSFGGTLTLNITSIRETYLNGELLERDENWGYTLSADSSVSIEGNKVTIGENLSNYDITKIIRATQNESGKQLEIVIQQSAGSVEGEYVFSVSPTSLAFNVLGESKNFSVTSKYQYTFNGEKREKDIDWEVQSISSPFSVDGNTVTIGENTNSNTRSGSLILVQSESSKTIEIGLSQPAASITYDYTFSVSPTELDFSATGDTKSVTVTSSRSKYINGKLSSTENWNYSRSNGSNVSGSDTSITMGENKSSSTREGSVTFTQNDSNKSVTVTCNQEAATIQVNYTFTVSPTKVDVGSEGGSTNLTIVSNKEEIINGTPTITHPSWTNTTTNWINWEGNSKFNVLENPNTTERSYIITLTQEGSNKTATVIVNQEAKVIEDVLTWEDGSTEYPTLIQWGTGSKPSSIDTECLEFTMRVYSIYKGKPVEPTVKTSSGLAIALKVNSDLVDEASGLYEIKFRWHLPYIVTQYSQGDTDSLILTQSSGKSIKANVTFNVTKTSNLHVTFSQSLYNMLWPSGGPQASSISCNYKFNMKSSSNSYNYDFTIGYRLTRTYSGSYAAEGDFTWNIPVWVSAPQVTIHGVSLAESAPGLADMNSSIRPNPWSPSSGDGTVSITA